MKRTVIIITAIVCALLTAITVFFYSSYMVASAPVIVREGGIPDYSHITEDPILSRICSIETDVEKLNTSSQGKTAVSIKMLALSFKSEVTILPHSVPDIAPVAVTVTAGQKVSADMFISHPDDVQCFFENGEPDTDTVGSYTISLYAQRDEEPTYFSSTLNVIKGDSFTFDFGTSPTAVMKSINSDYRQISELDVSSIASMGEFSVRGYSEGGFFLLKISILPPSAEDGRVRSFDLILGEKLTKDDILGSLAKTEGVSATMTPLPDFTKAGDFEVTVTLTYGDTVDTQISHIRIHDIPSHIEAEILSTNEELSRIIFGDNVSHPSLSFGTDHVSKYMLPGENKIFLSGEYSAVTVNATIVDKTAPTLKLKPIKYALGQMPSASLFVSEYYDATEVSFYFADSFSCLEKGKKKISIIAEDTSGNKTKSHTTVSFSSDTSAPKITGAKDMTVLTDSNPDFLRRISVTDDLDPSPTLSADYSQVDTSKAGVYPLIITASDATGNVSEIKLKVTVSAKAATQLKVENILQYPKLPNGCEITSLAIVLNYLGFEVDHLWLCDNYLPIGDYVTGDPWKCNVGDPHVDGMGCYAPVIEAVANDYLTDIGSSLRAYDVSGKDISYYESYIERGIPVILWGTMYMIEDDSLCWQAQRDGETVVWHAYSHCLVLIGYNTDNYIFCDPMRREITEYSREKVEKCFEINFRQACIIE